MKILYVKNIFGLKKMPNMEYEKWEVYFKKEVIGDVFVWNFRWRMKMI
jgi:hypothetical protein